MKNLFDTYLHKISNLLGRNESTFIDTSPVDSELDDNIAHMSYSDYIKFINEEENKKATPLQPDHFAH